MPVINSPIAPSMSPVSRSACPRALWAGKAIGARAATDCCAHGTRGCPVAALPGATRNPICASADQANPGCTSSSRLNSLDRPVRLLRGRGRRRRRAMDVRRFGIPRGERLEGLPRPVFRLVLSCSSRGPPSARARARSGGTLDRQHRHAHGRDAHGPDHPDLSSPSLANPSEGPERLLDPPTWRHQHRGMVAGDAAEIPRVADPQKARLQQVLQRPVVVLEPESAHRPRNAKAAPFVGASRATVRNCSRHSG